MGKATGFLEFERVGERYQPVKERLGHYREFVAVLDDAEAGRQAARCMDCGIPFCNTGCPVHNVIPDFNDLVYRQDWRSALTVLHGTNNFPEFTGRVCPAPCEAACTLGINAQPVGIKSLERAIVEKGWSEGWIGPQPAARATGKKVAVVGSGPAGLAAAQQLARAGHAVTVFEKNEQPGGLLRYGIPDFKLEQRVIDRRLGQLAAEGVQFQCNTLVSAEPLDDGIANAARRTVLPQTLLADFDAVILAGGAEVPRDLPVAGRELDGIHFALELLIAQNRQVGGGDANPIDAKGRHVVVIGGGDTGSDCVGTANRHGAASVTQLELMAMPPEQEDKPLTWPYWPVKLRTSSSHEEGCERDFAVMTKAFVGEDGRVTALRAVRLDWRDGRPVEVPGSEFELKADLVFLAMGFTHPAAAVLSGLGVTRDARGNAEAATDGGRAYRTNVDKVFAAGDMRRGQSLVVWAIREGRQCAREVDAFLMGYSELPR
ncbi:glutamate synthase subunit beta [Chitiniphilus shinanonensis]|uniref:Glutamate synthase subunit beta n=1 Tax=Chitiniphilus shinanonensis TaxID=553088 RepID=A0ABQ6BP03_9NEIS|nr:glutamate synthase subunit beta [Chitiniphilus shinanonensis]GLS03576.1 glutamate synthase subunit beta [Chitiniphilus shinanonensis]